MEPLAPRPDVMAFLATRRSRPAKTLTGPAPDRAALEPILRTALRVPDHGKLEPWRLIVLEGAALDRLAALTEGLGARQGRDPDKLPKQRAMFADAPLMVAVVAAPVASEKIPEVEQVLSAGALCHNLVAAAQAAGWGANWLSGWMATDRDFLLDGLSLARREFVAGFVVIGSETTVPTDRPRPDPAAKIAWLSE
ncbi:nitroreductase family protein [Jannaschia ovalis]|uniref:Putative NAD(P)H nitroreductase n=1 Tax=Jannaschia ovalis TaxID=3038773 RepID=A0ABY8LIH6_9RHOB|nr:nitroreductase family protein [Jannaschia sp. GRR-S6-38]WGH79903.1 nitroreductase family protein [Jannaschia sp. GRR-S6-38]